jgi:hypothetical protein
MIFNDLIDFSRRKLVVVVVVTNKLKKTIVLRKQRQKTNGIKEGSCDVLLRSYITKPLLFPE